jgi:hypothetical protein
MSTESDKQAEPIEMQERRYGYFPKLFTWRGRQYRVTDVERCWTDSRHGQEHHCFRVRCSPVIGRGKASETFEVFQDVRQNTWHLRQQADGRSEYTCPIFDGEEVK